MHPHPARARRRASRSPLIGGLAATCVVAAGLLTAPVANASLVPAPIEYSADGAALSLSPIGTYDTGVFDESAAEIVQAFGDRLFVVNAQAGTVSVLDYGDPTAIAKEFAIGSDGVANSVAVRSDGLGVIAFEAPEKTDAGHLVFFDARARSASSAVLGEVVVGALPDMVSISADGKYAVVANEGEPADDFSTDPEGSVAVVTLPAKVKAPKQKDVRIADFHAFEAGGSKTLPDGVRVFGPAPEADLPVSRNLEPEYVAIEGGTAYVTLQEANAMAVVDLKKATVRDIWALGYKDLGLPQNALDPSDRDPKDAPAFGLRTFPGLYGMYQPDGVNAYTVRGTTYLVTANEGDAREWGDYSEVSRVKDLKVCADSPLAGYTKDKDLGRLNVTTELGFDQAAGCYGSLYAFGGRSFSIWTTDGTQVYDSSSSFEEITHAANPAFFNSNHSATDLEGRSDDKGPEPENLSIGSIGGRTYAFIGFERVGGVAVYDISTPAASRFVTYINNRDFSVSVEDADDTDAALAQAGDLGPEGVTFVDAAHSPTGVPLLAVANEVSGTTTLFSITDLLVPVNTEAPRISGTPAVGKALTATPGTWAPGVGDQKVSYRYQWLRDGVAIKNATKSTYRVEARDKGRALSVRVTAVQGSATASADSTAVTVARGGYGHGAGHGHHPPCGRGNAFAA